MVSQPRPWEAPMSQRGGSPHGQGLASSTATSAIQPQRSSSSRGLVRVDPQELMMTLHRIEVLERKVSTLQQEVQELRLLTAQRRDDPA